MCLVVTWSVSSLVSIMLSSPIQFKNVYVSPCYHQSTWTSLRRWKMKVKWMKLKMPVRREHHQKDVGVHMLLKSSARSALNFATKMIEETANGWARSQDHTWRLFVNSVDVPSTDNVFLNTKNTATWRRSTLKMSRTVSWWKDLPWRRTQ